MAIDNTLEIDEAQRAVNYEEVKSNVESKVNAEISAKANQTTASQQQYVEDIAKDLRGKAINEVAETEKDVERGRFFARVSQIVDYIFFLIYGLLTLRLLLELFNARESAGFVQFIKSITNVFYAPFKNIVVDPSKDGFTLSLSIVIALVVYMMLHLAINNLLRIFVHRKTTV